MMRAWAASFSGGMVWLIIRNPTVSRPSSRASPKCWMDTSASVQWVAIRQIDPPLFCASLMSSLVPTPGQHQERDLGLLGGLGRELDQLLLGRLGEAVVEARPAEPVAVGHLDDRHAGGVQRRDDGVHFLLGELVTLVVRPVAQRRVGDADVPHRIEEDVGAHALGLLRALAAVSLAISSPTLVAAAVMMSRLPAYGGR